METKTYRLLNATTVMPVVIHYQPVEDGIAGETQSVVVYVDYSQDEVYFPNNPELNTDEMRQAILNKLDPAEAFVESPEVPSSVMDLIEQIRLGNYGTDLSVLKNEEPDGDE